MSVFMLTDGTYVVSLNPEWNIKFDDRKVETAHRTRSGKMFRYVWGKYDRCKFDAQFISSADMCQINSWWYVNVPLVLYDINSSVVLSGYLVNAAAPVSELVMPYPDYFKGTIELEAY